MKKKGSVLKAYSTGVTVIKNIIKQVVPDRKIDTSEDITTWEFKGGSNDFPQQLIAAVEGSPSAS